MKLPLEFALAILVPPLATGLAWLDIIRRPLVRVFLILVFAAASLSIPASGTYALTSAAPTSTAACSPAAPAPAGGTGAPLTASGTDFGFAAFHRLFASAPRGNTFISPISISLALEMVYEGARGNTRASMARVLGIGRLTPLQVNRDAAALISALQRGEPGKTSRGPGYPATPPTQLRIADSIWSRSGIPFQQSFLDMAQRYFDARASSLNFDSPDAVKTVNAWVSCATRGKITSIVSSLRAAIMLLINAVYFQGSWTNPFNVRDTHQQPFTLASGRSITVPMMHLGGRVPSFFPYYAGKDVQVVELPYGLSRRFSMVIVLPHRGTSLAQFAPRLTRSNWGYWIKKMGNVYQHGILAMPRINVTYGQDLKRALVAMGMGTAFSPHADFSGLCTIPCKITHVLHKTFLHVDEKGTTAAGVTAVEIGGGGGFPPPHPFHMTVDRPFFLGIRDGRSGAVLFLGAVNRP